MVMREKRGGGQVPGFDAPSIFPDEIFDPGASIMLGVWDFHYNVQMSINLGKMLLTRFVTSDRPEAADKTTIDCAHSWNALVKAYTDHPKIQFAEVVQDDITTMGGLVLFLGDGTELQQRMTNKKPYVHYFTRKTDVGGGEFAPDFGKALHEALQDPYVRRAETFLRRSAADARGRATRMVRGDESRPRHVDMF